MYFHVNILHCNSVHVLYAIHHLFGIAIGLCILNLTFHPQRYIFSFKAYSVSHSCISFLIFVVYWFLFSFSCVSITPSPFVLYSYSPYFHYRSFFYIEKKNIFNIHHTFFTKISITCTGCARERPSIGSDSIRIFHHSASSFLSIFSRLSFYLNFSLVYLCVCAYSFYKVCFAR